MYNTILQTSLLLFGSDSKTIRFEANMLRSLGIKSIRGIVDIEGYLKKRTIYPNIDAFLIHEHCTPYTGIELIEKFRLEYFSNTPIILVLSSPPSVHLMQTLESLSSVALVRPYTRRDVQRALVQSKRLISEANSVESMYYQKVEEQINAGEDKKAELPANPSDTFLVAMIHFQFFLRSQDYEKAVQKLLLIYQSMSTKRMLSLIERTAQETPNKMNCIQSLCDVLYTYNKELAHTVGEALLEGYEHKITIKKLSERKARIIAKGEVPSGLKVFQ